MNKLPKCNWPYCECHEYLALWSDRLQDPKIVWHMSQLEIVEDMAFTSLACARERCPDRWMRAAIDIQLRKPFWDKQKSKSIWYD
jgi:hypothetical protein